MLLKPSTVGGGRHRERPLGSRSFERVFRLDSGTTVSRSDGLDLTPFDTEIQPLCAGDARRDDQVTASRGEEDLAPSRGEVVEQRLAALWIELARHVVEQKHRKQASSLSDAAELG